jgi:thiol-disulfide isomerase/thioredoxin
MASGSDDEIEEERRLLYVAMTRAMDHLSLVTPLRFHVRQQGAWGDRHVYAQPSRFLTRAVCTHFDHVSWPAPEAQAATAPRSGPTVDLQAHIRRAWARREFLAAFATLAAGLLVPVTTARAGAAGGDTPRGAEALTDRPFASGLDALPHPVADLRFVDGNGRPHRLDQFHGKVVLLNVWATWCPPCREEMPTLEHLQAQLGGPDFEVLALSIDRGGIAAVASYFDEIDVHALKIYVDPTTAVANDLDLTAYPTTLLIDRRGRELARHIGPAAWDNPAVIALIKKVIVPGAEVLRTRLERGQRSAR